MLQDAFLAMNVYLPWGRIVTAKEEKLVILLN